MGRRRRPNTNTTIYTRVRDPFAVARPFQSFLSPLVGLQPDNSEVRSHALSEIEDLRYWHPAETPVRSSRRSGVTPTPQRSRSRSGRQRSFFSPVVTVMGFKAPRTVAVCVRRKVRDQVLHALGKTGRGSGRPRRFTKNSNVRC